MEPEQLSLRMRDPDDERMRPRRGVVALSMAAAASMSVIALYQAGLLRHLPQPKVRWIDSDRVDASPLAYSRGQVGDAFLGALNWSVTATLAAMGGPDRAREQPWIPIALAGKVAFDVANVARMSSVQWSSFRAFCVWCLAAGVSTCASAPLVVPEARDAVHALRKRAAEARR
jgi:uncharacterized membrane protein